MKINKAAGGRGKYVTHSLPACFKAHLFVRSFSEADNIFELWTSARCSNSSIPKGKKTKKKKYFKFCFYFFFLTNNNEPTTRKRDMEEEGKGWWLCLFPRNFQYSQAEAGTPQAPFLLPYEQFSPPHSLHPTFFFHLIGHTTTAVE